MTVRRTFGAKLRPRLAKPRDRSNPKFRAEPCPRGRGCGDRDARAYPAKANPDPAGVPTVAKNRRKPPKVAGRRPTDQSLPTEAYREFVMALAHRAGDTLGAAVVVAPVGLLLVALGASPETAALLIGAFVRPE